MNKAAFKSIVALSVVVAFLLPSLASTTDRTNPKYKRKQKSMPIAQLDYKPGEVLVKFKNNVSSSKQRSVTKKAGGEKTLKNLKVAGKQVAKVVEVKEGVSVESAIKKFEADNSVEYAEPNYINRISYAINDPSFSGNQWAFNNTGQVIGGVAGTVDADIDALEAWDVEDGSSNPVTVAIIDSGMDTAHPDLAAKMWQNSGETAGDGLDNDGNGYVDDTNGYNFAGISQYAANVFQELGSENTYEIAQSIKGTGRALTHIGLMLSKVGMPSSNITVSVRQTLGGDDLASYIITPSDVMTYPYDIEYKALSSSVNLANGTTYYIVFKTNISDANNYYLVADNFSGAADYENDPYKDGIEHWYNGSIWTEYPDDDFYFITNPNTNPRDDNGHGTHVGGIVGADTNNSTGIAGTAPGAKLMALKAADSSGSFYTSDVIEAINYASGNGAKVINMSFGGTSNSAAQQQAVTDAYNAGVTLFASAGNSGDYTMYFPAGHANVIGVGATTNQDQKASFSTYNSSVDISAPGSSIYSTMPTYAVGLNSAGYNQNYDFLSGTSMASPMAAGVGALVLSRNPTFTPSQVQVAMQSYAEDKGTTGRDDSFGHGRINANSTLAGFGYKPRTYAPYKRKIRRGSRTRLYWKVRDPYTGNKASVRLNIQKRVKSLSRIRRRARYLKLFRIWRSRYLRTRNRTLKRRYRAAYNKYLRAYRRTSPYFYRTVRDVHLGWTTINRLRYYLQKFNYSGTYRFSVYAKDKAGNKQYNIARNYVVVY